MNLQYDLCNANDSGEYRHAQTVMRELGIEYEEAVPMSMFDRWYFNGCQNVPAELPSFIRERIPGVRHPTLSGVVLKGDGA